MAGMTMRKYISLRLLKGELLLLSMVQIFDPLQDRYLTTTVLLPLHHVGLIQLWTASLPLFLCAIALHISRGIFEQLLRSNQFELKMLYIRSRPNVGTFLFFFFGDQLRFLKKVRSTRMPSLSAEIFVSPARSS